jgi:toxin ParE1/3/4
MIYKIIVTPDVISEIDATIKYYKSRASLKIARDFINDYRKTFKDIQRTKYFKVYFQDFRVVPMKKFPYILFYTIDDRSKIITIKGIFHTSQNPDKYPKI